jgi:antitoxin (DNA-binding transcriptional repressor) of toxin-antitoxin stability system
MEVDGLSSVKQAGRVMKTATVTEAGLDFLSVLKWVETGEEVQVVREGKSVAVISRAPRSVKHPDYLARLKQTFGENVLSSEASAAIRDSNRGER